MKLLNIIDLIILTLKMNVWDRIQKQNLGWGGESPYSEINHHYYLLCNRFRWDAVDEKEGRTNYRSAWSDSWSSKSRGVWALGQTLHGSQTVCFAKSFTDVWSQVKKSVDDEARKVSLLHFTDIFNIVWNVFSDHAEFVRLWFWFF